MLKLKIIAKKTGILMLLRGFLVVARKTGVLAFLRVLFATNRKRKAVSEFNILRNQHQYELLMKTSGMKTIRSISEQLNTLPKGTTGLYSGFCVICNRDVDFSYAYAWNVTTQQDSITFREQFSCPVCQNFNCTRAVASVMLQYIKNNDSIHVDRFAKKTIYIHEAVTPFYKAIYQKLSPFHTVIGSEYLGETIHPGDLIDGIRHEDILNLSFNNESVDMIVSNDVFEHIPDIGCALREAYRVLKHNGILIGTFPFIYTDSTQVRARMENGKLEFLEEPVYHGNPVSGKDALVFYYYGWDILDMARSAGFSDVSMMAVSSVKCANLGKPILVFTAQKAN